MFSSQVIQGQSYYIPDTEKSRKCCELQIKGNAAKKIKGNSNVEFGVVEKYACSLKDRAKAPIDGNAFRDCCKESNTYTGGMPVKG